MGPYLRKASLWIAVSASLWAARQAGAQPQFLQEKMVDLTHVLKEGVPQFSEDVTFKHEKISDYGNGYRSFIFSAPEHVGTHVDAPMHFYQNKKSVDEIETRELVGYANVINVKDQVIRNPDYLLSLNDLRNWESAHGPIRKDSIVILYTGWEARWFRPKDYLNRDRDGTMHFPGFSCEVADYLANNRSVRALGTDTLSIDAGNSTDYCAHRILHHANKYAIEGLTNLEKLPPRGAAIVVAPLKLSEGSGSPARVIAWVP